MTSVRRGTVLHLHPLAEVRALLFIIIIVVVVSIVVTILLNHLNMVDMNILINNEGKNVAFLCGVGVVEVNYYYYNFSGDNLGPYDKRKAYTIHLIQAALQNTEE